RILDWYKKDSGRDSYPAHEDPGVLSVSRIYNYYKKFGYNTEIMGASFRNMGEIVELAGCDLLTISPALLDELLHTEGDLVRKLDPIIAAQAEISQIPMDKATFDAMHASDRMASEKLDEGIKGFSKALVTLEELLTERLTKLEEPVLAAV
ncbi:MAG: transaldolase family protein, partial [Pseudanabaena sp.]